MDLRDLVAASSEDSVHVSMNARPTPSSASPLKQSPPSPLSPPNNIQKLSNDSTSSPKSLPSPEPSPSTHFFATPLPQLSSMDSLKSSKRSVSMSAVAASLPRPGSLIAPTRTLRKRKSSDLLSVMLDSSTSSSSAIPENNNSDSSENEQDLNSRRIKRRASHNSLRSSNQDTSATQIKREYHPSPAPLQLPQLDEVNENPPPPASDSSAILVQVSQSPSIALTAPTTISSTSSSSRRHAHILSEQRRRENINGGFQLLKNSVPFCKGTQDSKAMILKKAVDYIVSLEQELSQLRYQDPNYHYQMMNSSHAPPQPPQHPQHPQHPHHMRPNSSTHPNANSPYYSMHAQGSHPGPSPSPISSMYEGPAGSPLTPHTHLPGVGPPPPSHHPPISRADTPPSTTQSASGYLPGPLPFPGPPGGHGNRASSFSHSYPRSVRSPYYYQLGGANSGTYGPGNITRPTSTPPLHSYSLNPPKRSGASEEPSLQFGNQIVRPQTASIAETKP